MTFASVFPPMATPFSDDGAVETSAIAANVEKWMRAGTGGVVALGSNGEAPLLDEAESDRVIAAARDAVPRDRLLIAGTGRESTPATIAASKRAAALGADAVLVRTPSYYKGRMTVDALARHYSLVADGSPVPVLLYNYPAVSGINLVPALIARLSQHANIAGIKETGSDAAQVGAFVDAAAPSFSVIAGSAPPFYPALCMGAVGGILAVACVVPEICVQLFQHFRAGRHAEARELQRRITPLARLVTTEYGVPGLKAAMTMAGYRAGMPRLPLTPASGDALNQIRAALAALPASAEVVR
jgi:dihydrodipicolinate synthase/N-acetylneuraminate lyase